MAAGPLVLGAWIVWMGGAVHENGSNDEMVMELQVS